MKELKKIFEGAYLEYHRAHYREKDPISLVHLFTDQKDQEIVAFFVALVSYGNVKSILNNGKKLVSGFGDSPRQVLESNQFNSRFSGFVHRFTREEDFVILSYWVAGALREFGSLQEAFVHKSEGLSTKEKISQWVNRLRSQRLPAELQKNLRKRQRNLKYLLSSPEEGSACKRINLFLRWVVRKSDGLDLGLWDRVDPADLMLPIDTHILKTLQRLGWTQSKNATWKVVEEATHRLRALQPSDPIRYDFSLCHLSMEGQILPVGRRS